MKHCTYLALFSFLLLIQTCKKDEVVVQNFENAELEVLDSGF